MSDLDDLHAACAQSAQACNEAGLVIDDRLLDVGGLTNGMISGSITTVLDTIQANAATNDNVAEVRDQVIAQLHGELGVLNQLDQNAPADPDQWPRQRRAIQRAYDYLGADVAAADAQAADAQGQADDLNNMLNSAKKAAGDAGKGLLDGLEGVLGLVVVLVVLLVIASFAKGRA